MKENQEIIIEGNNVGFSIPGDVEFKHLNVKNNETIKPGTNFPGITTAGTIMYNIENIPEPLNETKIRGKKSELLPQNNTEKKISVTSSQNSPNLFRLFVKNGEYVYARANDIIMMESCDHLVKVYLAFNDKIKKTIRHNTLKDFLLQLPQEQFIRIGRFCAINIQRLSGGNCNEQTFEFDFRFSIKLKHAISHTAFYTIGK